MAKHREVEEGHFVVVRFERWRDAQAAVELVQELFPNEQVHYDTQRKEAPRKLESIEQRRLAIILVRAMREHPNRCWEREDLYIVGQENLYSFNTVDSYIPELVRLGVIKVLKTGGIVLVKKDDDAATPV